MSHADLRKRRHAKLVRSCLGVIKRTPRAMGYLVRDFAFGWMKAQGITYASAQTLALDVSRLHHEAKDKQRRARVADVLDRNGWGKNVRRGDGAGGGGT